MENCDDNEEGKNAQIVYSAITQPKLFFLYVLDFL